MIARGLALLAVLAFAGGAVDPNDPFKAAAIVERPGAAIPLDQVFVDSSGQPTTLRRIAAGKPLLITPVQHECPNICGVTLAGIAAAIDGQDKFQPGRNFAIVALGIDPREGPAAARDDLRRLAAQRAAARWQPIALTGNARPITDALGYRYAWSDQLRQYAHLSATAVVTPDGKLSSWLYGLSPTPAQFDAALSQAAASRTGSVMQRLLLLCFHYDPSTGRYSLAITKALRLAGVATVLLIGLAIWLLSRRGRRAS
jgi:protein SCO1/2